MTKYAYTLKETSDSKVEIMDVIQAPDVKCAYELIQHNIEQLNNMQPACYAWKLSSIEHGDFLGINDEKTCNSEKCDYDCDCDYDELCCDDKEYGDYDDKCYDPKEHNRCDNDCVLTPADE